MARRLTTKRRRRRRNDSVLALPVLALVVVVVYVLALSVWQATDGLVLIPVVALGVAGAWLVIRRKRRARVRRLRNAADLRRLRAMAPSEFEATIAAVLGYAGWKLRVVGGSGDEGADLVGTDPQGARSIVQCKRYASSNAIGSPVVQLVIGARAIHRAQRALVVTTSRFTAPAQRLAERERIELVDGERVIQLARMGLDPAETERRPQ